MLWGLERTCKKKKKSDSADDQRTLIIDFFSDLQVFSINIQELGVQRTSKLLI